MNLTCICQRVSEKKFSEIVDDNGRMPNHAYILCSLSAFGSVELKHQLHKEHQDDTSSVSSKTEYSNI